MNQPERRRHPRHDTDVEATISVNKQQLSTRMIDISAGGICVIADKAIAPGCEVSVSFELEGCYEIRGSVVWTLYVYDGSEIFYRMGIEADSIALDEIQAVTIADRSQLLTELLFEIKSQKRKAAG